MHLGVLTLILSLIVLVVRMDNRDELHFGSTVVGQYFVAFVLTVGRIIELTERLMKYFFQIISVCLNFLMFFFLYECHSMECFRRHKLLKTFVRSSMITFFCNAFAKLSRLPMPIGYSIFIGMFIAVCNVYLFMIRNTVVVAVLALANTIFNFLVDRGLVLVLIVDPVSDAEDINEEDVDINNNDQLQDIQVIDGHAT